MAKKRDYIRKALTWRERSEVNADFYAEYECPETKKVTSAVDILHTLRPIVVVMAGAAA